MNRASVSLGWTTSLAVAFAFGAGAVSAVDGTFESDAPVQASSQIDKLVLAKLEPLNIRPVLCSDEAFVRRAYLDVIGLLPTAAEARDFIRDPDVQTKRRVLIDRLLERPEFADYWAMRWSDILRIKAEFPVNLWPNAAQAYHRWVQASLAENKPYDQFVRELLTSSGSNFRVAPVNFYRAVQSRTPEGIAGAVALTFMGERTEAWPPERVSGMAAFFSQIGFKPTSEWKEENVIWDPLGASLIPGNIAPGRDAVEAIRPPVEVALPTNRPPRTAVFPDGTAVKLPGNKDPREIFADWLISPRNPRFAQVAVNRVWHWLLGRGIIHEPDDIRPDNPPSNPALLAYLEKELISHKYDLKHIYRLILNSSVYQFSSMPRFKDPAAEANFAVYPLRRLDAEVLIDALNAISETSELYTSPIPEPFTYIPADMRAVQIADGSISSSFLTMFGRTARATGMENERDNRPLPAQWRHMLNSSQVQRKIEQGPGLRSIYESKDGRREVLERLYLTILSRFPTEKEIETTEAYFAEIESLPDAPPSSKADFKRYAKDAAQGGDKASAKAAAKAEYAARQAAGQKRRDGWVDITWSLINSSEFLYRH